jgi:hypothetical protein
MPRGLGSKAVRGLWLMMGDWASLEIRTGQNEPKKRSKKALSVAGMKNERLKFTHPAIQRGRGH